MFEKSGINEATVYNSYNLCPCARPAHVSECWPGPKFKSSKTVTQWKSDGLAKIYNSVSPRSPLTKSKKKNIIESAAI